MRIALNRHRARRAVALVCFLLAMVIIIGGLGIWIICRLCKKLDRINQGDGSTNQPPWTNGDVSIYSLTIQKSANLCDWTNFAYVTGFVSRTEFHLTVLDASTNVLTNYTLPLSPQLYLTNSIEDHSFDTNGYYRVIGTNEDGL